MRVEIITLHSVANYGTQLQALATQKKLSEYFDDVEFIDFRRSDTYGIGLFKRDFIIIDGSLVPMAI